jgi:hypothetical protein
VSLQTDGQTLRQQVNPTRSYLSQCELPVTFGLGESTQPQTVTIHWPSGIKQKVDALEVDKLHVIEERQ